MKNTCDIYNRNQELELSIVKFMQQEDKNGIWMEEFTTKKEDQLDILEECYFTINNWLDDGLDRTKRIEGYLEYIATNIFKNPSMLENKWK